MGGPLLGSPVGVPSLVQIGWKLKNFSLLLWRRHCVASLPHPGCLLPPWARPYAAFSRPVLPCSQRPKTFQVHKHGYIGAWNCHNFFTVKAILMKFATHIGNGSTHLSAKFDLNPMRSSIFYLVSMGYRHIKTQWNWICISSKMKIFNISLRETISIVSSQSHYHVPLRPDFCIILLGRTAILEIWQ